MTNTAVELEALLAENRPSMTLLERVEARAEIDQVSGVIYPDPSTAQMRRLARITAPGLRRILTR
ncbi:hypothetical protein ACWFRB_09480 [Rhodococcus sp. NPDC055112]